MCKNYANKKILKLFVLIFLLGNPAFFYAAEPVSLNALVNEALEKNPQIQAAKKSNKKQKTFAALCCHL